MFKMMDKDKNGVMEFEEFVLILVLPKSAEEISTEQFATRRKFMKQNIYQLFLVCMTIYDEDGNGVITKDELLKFALAKAKAEGRDQQNQQITEVVNKIVNYIDTNSDGQVTKDELIQAINK